MHYISRNLFVCFIILSFVFLPLVTAQLCKVVPAASGFLDKFLPSLISSDEQCSPQEKVRKESFKNCMMMLVEGDPDLCDVNEFFPYELPHCAEAIKQNNFKLNIRNKINGFWNYVDLKVHQATRHISLMNLRNTCPKLPAYFEHYFNAFGGQIKNETLWTDYCKDKAANCAGFNRFFDNDNDFVDSVFLISYLKPKKPTLEGTAYLFSRILIPFDLDRTKLEFCLLDLFKAIKNRLSK